MDNLLSIVIFLPSLAALILAVILRGEDELSQRNAKILALIATLATFVVSLQLLTQLDPTNTNFQFIEEYNLLAFEDVKKLNIFSRLMKSINFLIWGDV